MAGPTSSYDRGYRSEVASGLAGTSVARQQGPLDFLKEAFGNVGNYFSRGFESGLGDVDIASGLSNIRATDPGAGVGNIQRAIEGFEPAKFAEAGSALLSPAYATYLKSRGQAPSGGVIFDGLYDSAGNQPRGQNVDDYGPYGAPLGGANDLQHAIDTIRDSGSSDSDFAAQDTLLKTAYQRRQEDFYAGLNSMQAQITGDYQDRIGELSDELGKYRGGLTDVNSAYSDYADDANAILAAASAGVEGEAIPDSAVLEVVGEDYDNYNGEMQAALQRIDASGNTELAKAMAGEVRYMEEVVADGLRSGLASQTELHNLAAAEAQALAHMSWKDNAYEGERSRFMLEMQINQQIQNKQDEIAAAKAAMDTALRDAKANYGEFTLTPDELWGEAMNDYFSSSGLNLQEQQEMRGLWEAVMQNPQAMVNYDTFKASVMQGVNEHNLAIVGALDDYDRIMANLTESANNGSETSASVLAQIQNTMTQPLSVASLKALTTAASNFGIDLGALGNIDLDTVPWDELEDSASLKYQKMLDLWGHHNDYRNNYEDYISTQASTYPTTGGSQAPNNALNKNEPAYAYRRDVTAPYFADLIKSTFPSMGVEIGGLGYNRPPGDVGGGKSANSDHQSGGAIDVYASTEQGRKAIANWARNQPGVSLVIYEGNSAHEGHHVHISFQIGYTPSGLRAAPQGTPRPPVPRARSTSTPPRRNRQPQKTY